MHRFSQWVSAVSLLVAGVAAAQTAPPQADLEQVWLDPAGRGSLWVGNGQVLPARGFRAGASLFFTHGQLASPSAALVSDRLGVQVMGAFGVTDWLELSANVPVYVYQEGAKVLSLASAGMGNPWLTAKVALLGPSAPVSLAVLLGAGFPVGSGAAMGNGGLEVSPRVQLGHVFTTWQLAGEVGFLYRRPVDFSGVSRHDGDVVGSQLFAAAAVTAVNDGGPRAEASLRLTAPLRDGAVGLEALLGLRWQMGSADLFGAVGPGFAGAPSTPSVRAYFGVAFGNVDPTRRPCVEGKPYVIADCPDLDFDGDGVPNGVDGAPTEAEDIDGFEDGDGVPDPDNDGDGVPDVDDRCPMEPGPGANGGCPDVDTDGDGVVDRLDKCPTEPEDVDGFEDGDGCPDPDNDGDGILDADDACPLVAGIRQEKGCPAKDSDGDGVFDHEDNCPQDPGPKDNAGCPAKQKQLVSITDTALRILEKVYFDTGKATIQRRSNALLDNVARVLLAHPEIAKVHIEGHTDNTGNAEKNLTLSQARADAVKAYLVGRGLDAGRLEAHGFGDTRPAQPNETAAGREANRRVEFNL